MKAIYLKEMRSYFHSLAAYIYFALFIAATGVYFSVICMSYGYTDYSQYVFSNSTILYIVIVPILTMRLFAEEKKQRTDQLLYTSPIRPGSIVLGKYLASVTLLAMSMLVSLIRSRCIKYVWKCKLENSSYRLPWLLSFRRLPDGSRNVCIFYHR